MTTPSDTDWGVRTVAFLVAGALFMENLDGNIIATAAPSMGRYFGVTSAQIGVCATAYLVTVAALIPVSSWVAARFGAKPVYLVAIGVFTAASVLCAVSTTLTEITVMRVLQGAGGAMMVPVGRIVVLRATTKQNIIRAIAYLTWPALLAPVIAPAAGGLITTYATWQWIFLINLPLGIAALLAAVRLMPGQAPEEAGRLDWLGFTGTAVALACLTTVAALVGGPTVPWSLVAVLGGVGAAVGVAVTLHLLRTPNPLVVLRALRVRTFRAAATGGSAFRLGINGVPFLLPLLFQDQFGWTAARAGSMVLILFAGNVAIKPLTTPLLRRWRFRGVLAVTTACASLTVAACALLTARTPAVVIAGVLLASGVFRSIGYTGYNTIAFADIDQAEMSHANSFASTVQQLTQAFGVALAVIALKAGVHVVGDAAQFSFAFVVLAAVVAFATVSALMLPRSAGDTVRARA